MNALELIALCKPEPKEDVLPKSVQEMDPKSLMYIFSKENNFSQERQQAAEEAAFYQQRENEKRAELHASVGALVSSLSGMETNRHVIQERHLCLPPSELLDFLL